MNKIKDIIIMLLYFVYMVMLLSSGFILAYQNEYLAKGENIAVIFAYVITFSALPLCIYCIIVSLKK